MARHRRGRPVHGWLILDKPAGVGSTDAVGRVKWALGAQKAGHAGTLDPGATGVLAVALGEATKTVPFVTEALKCYRFTVRWGAATATDDAEGTVIETRTARPERAEIEAALPVFTGHISQVPPQVSAVKVAGERAYARARAGETMDLAARPLTVERLELVAVPDADTAVLEMVCGKGGYVRSIARDLGAHLGCLGHVTALRRLSAGPFAAEDGLGWAELEALARTPGLDARLLPLEAALAGMPELRATPEGAVRLMNGNPGAARATGPAAADWGALAWASHEGRPLAIGAYRGGELHPSRVFRLDGA